MQRLSELLGRLVLLGLVSLGYGLNENEPCTNPAGDSGRCIYSLECEPVVNIMKKLIKTLEEQRFISQSQCGKMLDGKDLVCCDISAINPNVSSKLPKPPNCGVDLSDRIYGGQRTNLNEHPWAAVIRYNILNSKMTYGCGATLINSRYVLTAAHCIEKAPRKWQLIGIRLGEWDLNSEVDCLYGECADAPVDMTIEKIIVHENYNSKSRQEHNDIALIRFTEDVNFTSFIEPVCLPIDNQHRTLKIVGTKGWTVGWGSTETGPRSDVKLKVELEIQDPRKCENIYSKFGLTLRDTQICAGGVRGQDTCSGDSGGGLTKLIRSNHFLYGIVGYGAKQCGTEGIPGIYTNVTKYIDWIESNIQ